MKIKLSKFIVLIFLIILSNSDKINAQMFWNQACSFAGTSSSYISCRNTSTTNITGNFTLEAWINPNSISSSSKGIIAKGGPLGTFLEYGMRLEVGGRIMVATNGAMRLRSKTTTTIPLNQWTHVCATFHFNTFVLYINGLLDTSANVGSAGISPVSNTDSLFIGISGASTPFSGIMDEVRIWNRDLSSNEVLRNYRLSLGTNSGSYSGLILSMTFQKENSGGVRFTANDWSNNGNFGTKVGVSQVDLSDKPSETISTNQCLSFFSPGSGYLAGPDNDAVSPTTGTTLQAWIYPFSTIDVTIIHKGPAAGGAGTNYSLNIINGKLAAKINGVTYDSQDSIPVNQWSHVAFTYTYNGVFRFYTFYVNGRIVRTNFSFGGGSITDGTDSLYIGGTSALPDFYGYLDEVRISKYAKSQPDILDSMYMSGESGLNTPGLTVAYNFDGYTYCSSVIGPFLFFRNSPYFTFPITTFHYPVSPLDKGYSLNFQNGFYMKTSGNRIPETGFTGLMKDDSLNIPLDENVSDINVFVALNHDNISELQISLKGPNGNTVQLMNSNTLIPGAYDMATVFDDQASSALVNNTYISFSNTLKPLNNLNSGFAGTNSKGLWRLVINDNSGTPTGKLYAWGIRFNNKTSLPKVLTCTALIQGFYNSSSNTMVRDTVRAYIRNTSAPYIIIDSSKAYMQSDGTGVFTFNSSNIIKGTFYYLQLSHRNSIETWSTSFGASFDAFTSQSTYDFTTDSSQAFGNNQIQVDNSPVKFAIYSGDVNQDGNVDLTDITSVFNDASNFVSGYVVTDVSGDNNVDLSDILITYNNSNNFVSKITP